MKVDTPWVKRCDLPKTRKLINADKVVVGQIVSILPHPMGDMLRLAQVDVGSKEFKIIFGGAVVESIGTKVAVALPGALTEGGRLRKRKFRGETSEAMICSAVELGIVNEGPDEILIMPDELEVGLTLKDFHAEQSDTEFATD